MKRKHNLKDGKAIEIKTEETEPEMPKRFRSFNKSDN